MRPRSSATDLRDLQAALARLTIQVEAAEERIAKLENRLLEKMGDAASTSFSIVTTPCHTRPCASSR